MTSNRNIAPFVGILLVALSLSAWATHVVYTSKAGMLLLLAIGGIFFPVGIVHGVMIWLGDGWG
jgi:hypothetical protein